MGRFGLIKIGIYIYTWSLVVVLAALLDGGSIPPTSTTFLNLRGWLDLTGSKDIMKINALIGTQIKSVKAGTFAALAAIRLLATEEVAVEENVLALAA